MTPLSSYLEYEAKVKKILKDKIQSELGTDCIICDFYKFKQYIFDLAVLDNQHNIVRVYEIKTPSSVKTNYNFIKALLREYKERTNADVYLAYLNNNGQLYVETLEKLSVEKSENTSVQKTINNFSEFYDVIKRTCSNSIDKMYFYRGHSNCIYKPIPGIYRDGYITYEEKMYHEAIRENPVEFTTEVSTFDKLVKMQHYELPTRLLDITTNPMVALYFACKGDEEKDGSVLIFPMVDKQIKYFDSDSVCVLSNLAKLPCDFTFNEKEKLVYEISQEKNNFNEEYLEPKALSEVICVLPKLNNDRIIRQHGAFFIFGMGKTKNRPAQFMDKPETLLIKATCKKEILKELQILGIDEAALFPEADKIMHRIKMIYSK